MAKIMHTPMENGISSVFVYLKRTIQFNLNKYLIGYYNNIVDLDEDSEN